MVREEKCNASHPGAGRRKRIFLFGRKDERERKRRK
jgi:hypothetical protein